MIKKRSTRDAMLAPIPLIVLLAVVAIAGPRGYILRDEGTYINAKENTAIRLILCLFEIFSLEIAGSGSTKMNISSATVHTICACQNFMPFGARVFIFSIQVVPRGVFKTVLTMMAEACDRKLKTMPTQMAMRIFSCTMKIWLKRRKMDDLAKKRPRITKKLWSHIVCESRLNQRLLLQRHLKGCALTIA
jgi:hypothetical protein